MLGFAVEILSLEPGDMSGVPAGLMMIRSETEKNPLLLLFNQEQCVRIRDSLDSFLNDRSSWLYMSREEQEAFQV